MNVMVGGLSGAKMSSSDPDSKIDLLDDKKTIEKKIKKAFCEEGNVLDNPLLSFMKYVVFPILDIGGKREFIITRSEKWGGDLVFKEYQVLHGMYMIDWLVLKSLINQDMFADKLVHPGDLKSGVANALDTIIDPIRETFKSEELRKLVQDAYPVESVSKTSKKMAKMVIKDVSV